MDKRRMNYRWHITVGCTVVFALVGFAVGWSVETKHPDDRFEDLMVPTLGFLAAGLLVGYVSSLVLHNRFTWFDALASILVPPVLFFGFLFEKSGDWIIGQSFGLGALGIVVFLVLRFGLASQREKDLDILRPLELGEKKVKSKAGNPRNMIR